MSGLALLGCRAGLRTVMSTGDYHYTALAGIALPIGHATHRSPVHVCMIDALLYAAAL